MSDNLSTRAQLVALFNEALAQQTGETAEYTESEVSFGEPELYDPSVLDLTNPQARNSRLLVEVEAEGEEGEEPQTIQMMLHYNRLDCGRLGTLLQQAVVLDEAITSTHQALPVLAEVFGIQLQAEDFEDVAIAGSGETGTLTLRAAAGSLGFIGAAQIAVSRPVVPTDPAQITDLSADYEADGDQATVSLTLTVAEGADPTEEDYMIDMVFENMTFASVDAVPEGLTLIAQPGTDGAQLAAPRGLAPGQYTVSFHTQGADGQTAAQAVFSMGDVVETLEIEFILG